MGCKAVSTWTCLDGAPASMLTQPSWTCGVRLGTRDGKALQMARRCLGRHTYAGCAHVPARRVRQLCACALDQRPSKRGYCLGHVCTADCSLPMTLPVAPAACPHYGTRTKGSYRRTPFVAGTAVDCADGAAYEYYSEEAQCTVAPTLHVTNLLQ